MTYKSYVDFTPSHFSCTKQLANISCLHTSIIADLLLKNALPRLTLSYKYAWNIFLSEDITTAECKLFDTTLTELRFAARFPTSPWPTLSAERETPR